MPVGAKEPIKKFMQLQKENKQTIHTAPVNQYSTSVVAVRYHRFLDEIGLCFVSDEHLDRIMRGVFQSRST